MRALRQRIFRAMVPSTAIALLVGIAPFAHAQVRPSAEALLQRYEDVMAPESFEAEARMVAHRGGGQRTIVYELRLLKSGDDLSRVTFRAPESAKGQEMLRRGDNLWLSLPNLERPMRAPPLGSFMGGDFSNADALRISYTADYEPKLADETDEAWVLELKAKRPDTPYERIRLWMSKDKEPMPLKAELYAKSGKLLRTATFSDVKDFGGGYRRPAKITVENELAKGRYSELEFKSVERKDIPAERFTLGDLGR